MLKIYKSDHIPVNHTYHICIVGVAYLFTYTCDKNLSVTPYIENHSKPSGMAEQEVCTTCSCTMLGGNPDLESREVWYGGHDDGTRAWGACRTCRSRTARRVGRRGSYRAGHEWSVGFFRAKMPSLSSSYNISGLVPACWLLFQCFVLKPAKLQKSWYIWTCPGVFLRDEQWKWTKAYMTTCIYIMSR